MALRMSEKIGWGLADMGIVVFVVVKQLLVFAFLTSALGVPVGLAGALTTGILIFDMITDPLIGMASDRTSSRWGRRAPWMVSGAVLLAGAMMGMFSASASDGPAAAAMWVAAFFALATIGFTMVAIPYGAMAGEITTDPRERSAMTAWRMGFASIGILLGGAVIPGLATQMGYAQAVAWVAPLIVGAVWLSVFLTRRAPRVTSASTAGAAEAWGLVLANRPFMVLTLLYGVMTFAIALITAGLPFAALYLVVDRGDTLLSGAAQALTVLSVLFAAFVVGALLSQAFWVWMSARLGKSGALTAGLLGYMGVLAALWSQIPSENVTLVAGLFVLAGVSNGAYQQIPWAMYPDLMDVTRAESGQAIEGAFSAIWLFGQKAANALAPLALGTILAIAGWVETTQSVVPQSDAALAALRLAITLVPAAILAVAMLGLFVIYAPIARRARKAAHVGV